MPVKKKQIPPCQCRQCKEDLHTGKVTQREVCKDLVELKGFKYSYKEFECKACKKWSRISSKKLLKQSHWCMRSKGLRGCRSCGKYLVLSLPCKKGPMYYYEYTNKYDFMYYLGNYIDKPYWQEFQYLYWETMEPTPPIRHHWSHWSWGEPQEEGYSSGNEHHDGYHSNWPSV